MFPEYEEKIIKPFKAGYTRPKLSSNIVGSTGKFQQPTKVDEKQLSSIIQTYAEARVSSKALPIQQKVKLPALKPMETKLLKKLPEGGKY